LGGTETGTATEASGQKPRGLSWRDAIEQTVTGLGYDLVDVERSGRGLLRVFIDRLPGRTYADGDSEFVTVDDCEQVTRQLQYVLEVEAFDYERLEVSSPGLDRPLRRAADYERFAGQEISLTLKQPFQGRKVWKGVLTRGDGEGWTLVFNDGKADQVLAFALDEVREARLVPVVDFKGRRGRGAAAEPTGTNGVLGGQER
jgi:ribosome maturation factor RimP